MENIFASTAASHVSEPCVRTLNFRGEIFSGIMSGLEGCSCRIILFAVAVTTQNKASLPNVVQLSAPFRTTSQTLREHLTCVEHGEF